MSALDLGAFRATPLQREPFDYLVLPGFIKPEARAAIHADYPQVRQPGSFPVNGLSFGPAFRLLIAALQGLEVRAAFEEKFGIDLRHRPTMVTVRGRCDTRDGHIHTDAVTKLITVLIYLNPSWGAPGGCLRLLRSPDDIEDVITEIPPHDGTLVAFRRANNSYHGHRLFIGERRVIQLNWVTSWHVKQRALLRHRLSAWMKTLSTAVRPAGPGAKEAAWGAPGAAPRFAQTLAGAPTR
jgi:hypothetical protein